MDTTTPGLEDVKDLCRRVMALDAIPGGEIPREFYREMREAKLLAQRIFAEMTKEQ